MLQQFVFLIALGALSVAPLDASQSATDTRIDAAQVASLLSSGGIDIRAAQVRLPTPVPVRHSNPPLEIGALQSIDKSNAKVRLRCREAGECLPFYVIVTWQNEQQFEQAQQRWRASMNRATSILSPIHRPLSVRAGESATLVLEGKNVRIQLPVICLNNGSAGEYIRVTTNDRKRIYRAEVVAPGWLKGGI